MAIVGTTGSGKSTLAKELARRCAMPHIELDAVFWGAGWTPTPPDQFQERVALALCGESWVTSGNYSSARKIIWTRADTIIWLDYSLSFVLRRLLKRTLQRLVEREELWNGNQESWKVQFLSRESLFVWALKTHEKHRREIPLWLALPECEHLHLIRFRDAHATEAWVKKL